MTLKVERDENQEPPIVTEDISTSATVSDEYHLSEEILSSLYKCSSNPGNFALKLVIRLFPELFGPDNLRLDFNYYGGGKKNKKQMREAGVAGEKARLSFLSRSEGNDNMEGQSGT